MTRLIDADALNYVRVRIYHNDGTVGGYNAVVPSSEIRHAPTVDAVPVRHGKWIYGENTVGYDGYYCSKCARHIRWHRGAEDIDFINNYYYCPECGAKMDAE